jgi:hypothetical protein
VVRVSVRLAVIALFALACGEPQQQRQPPPPPKPKPAASAPVCTPAPNRLCPSDAGASDPSFAQFRNELRAAVEQKNEAELVKRIASDVRTSFGDGGGIDDFRKSWKIGSANSQLWPTLHTILDLGGNFIGEGDAKSFWAPYAYANWPESIDAFENVAAVRAGVVLRAAPSRDAAQVAVVDWEILKAFPGHDSDWMKVKTSGGVEGWVSAADVYSPIGYRAGFSKRSGEWKLEALVAGD